MAQGNEDTKTTNRRTQVNDLPKPEKELTKEEQQQVNGGTQGGGIWIKSSAIPTQDQGAADLMSMHHIISD